MDSEERTISEEAPANVPDISAYREAKQVLVYWNWLKEHHADLLHFKILQQYRVYCPYSLTRPKQYALRATPEEAVQAAMDGQEV